MAKSLPMMSAALVAALGFSLVASGATQHSSATVCAGSDCPAGEPKSCSLLVENNTECPVQVYMDDRYLGVCESFSSTTYHVKRTGRVEMTGKAMCDTWGPDSRKLASDKEATWRITDKGRNACAR